MCLAIYKTESKILPFSLLKPMFDANPDGCGIMWSEKGELFAIKGHFDYQTFIRLYLVNMKKGNIVLHFRTASSGSMSFEKCHPFFVNDELAFVENGNLFEWSNYYPRVRGHGMTDVQRFNEEVLKRFPRNFLKIREYREALEQYCKNNFTKMIFMDNQGEVSIINEQSGFWDCGIWYSNGGIENYPGYGFSGVYYYNLGDIRHKGGITNVNVFGEKRKESWKLCPNCLGYYHQEKQCGEICFGCNLLKKIKELIT